MKQMCVLMEWRGQILLVPHGDYEFLDFGIIVPPRTSRFEVMIGNAFSLGLDSGVSIAHTCCQARPVRTLGSQFWNTLCFEETPTFKSAPSLFQGHGVFKNHIATPLAFLQKATLWVICSSRLYTSLRRLQTFANKALPAISRMAVVSKPMAVHKNQTDMSYNYICQEHVSIIFSEALQTCNLTWT